MWGGEFIWAWFKLHPLPDWTLRGLELAAYLLPIAGLGVALELFLTDEPSQRYSAFRPKSRS